MDLTFEPNLEFIRIKNERNFDKLKLRKASGV